MYVKFNPKNLKTPEEVKGYKKSNEILKKFRGLANEAIKLDDVVDIDFAKGKGKVLLNEPQMEGTLEYSPKDNNKLKKMNLKLKGMALTKEGNTASIFPTRTSNYSLSKSKGFLGLGKERTNYSIDGADITDNNDLPVRNVNKRLEIFQDGSMAYSQD